MGKENKKSSFILKTLNDFYPNPPIPLHYQNEFTFLVAVLLSAQCTDARVNTVTPLLFKDGKTPEHMREIGLDKIYEIIRPCGLAPRKSKAIYDLSAILLEKYEGEVPRSLEELEELPGVGHKTASVVMAQMFHVPTFPVDTHIHRLATRWKLTSGKNVVETERDLKKIFPQESWNKLHLQIIYYGREFCPARSHDIEKCPICLEVS